MQDVFERNLSSLPSTEKEVLDLYFGLSGKESPLTIDQIADRKGIKPEEVRKIKDRAVCLIKKKANGQ